MGSCDSRYVFNNWQGGCGSKEAKMSEVATVTIKYTESEVVLLINSLEMTTSAKVPCVEDGQWKSPYEKLKDDLIGVKDQLIEYKRQEIIKRR